ncbi:MAG TPA: fasciclin domain-containing protein [Methanocella sp.]|uniref:fasciclin domain-containing protein n=1 Tax=Methanocella sp. TaxID=2052833 RepID=UPI002B965370|nr:fasciclin domain-containing protein [Methanocella sp.]HTY91933.1 fasciclin domain-containing protein [Methanocella sp.]
MDRLRSILALVAFAALFIAAPAAAQSPFDGGGQMGMYGGMMGSPFGGMFQGMGMGSIEHYKAPAMEDSGKSILATMESVPQLSLFTAAIKDSAYADKLSGRGNFIVFAAPDKALTRDLAVRDIDTLLGDSKLAAGMVENAVVLAVDEPDEHSQELTVSAASGKTINVRKEKTGMAANGADVIKVFKATNGYVIVTDAAVGT